MRLVLEEVQIPRAPRDMRAVSGMRSGEQGRIMRRNLDFVLPVRVRTRSNNISLGRLLGYRGDFCAWVSLLSAQASGPTRKERSA